MNLALVILKTRVAYDYLKVVCQAEATFLDKPPFELQYFSF